MRPFRVRAALPRSALVAAALAAASVPLWPVLGPATGATAAPPAACRPTPGSLTLGIDPEFIAVGEGRVLVTNGGSHTTTVADGTAMRPLKTLAVGRAPKGVAVSHDGGIAVVASHVGGTLSVLDLAAPAVRRVIRLEPGLVGVAVDGAGTAYAAAAFTSAVLVVDLATGRVRRRVPIPDAPQGVALSRDGRTLYTANNTSVSVIASAQATVHVTDPSIRGAVHLAASPSGPVYVSATLARTVVAIDPRARRVVGSLPLPDAPQGISVSPDGRHLAVASGRNRLTVAALPALRPVTTLTLHGGPPGMSAVAFGAAGRLYVVKAAFHLHSPGVLLALRCPP